MNENILMYKKIPVGTDRYNYLSHAVPYGGHLAGTKLRPPLYEVEPDVLVVSDDLELLLLTLTKYLKKGKTIYFHPIVKENFVSTNDERLCELWSHIMAFHNDAKSKCLMLPPDASLFEVKSDLSGEVVEHYTQIFDYGDSDEKLLKTPKVKHWMNFLNLICTKEKMIWFNALPGSLISPIWSKRVITPKLTHWLVNNAK